MLSSIQKIMSPLYWSFTCLFDNQDRKYSSSVERKRGRGDWEDGCTAVRAPWCHVNHLVTSNLHPCIDQCLFQRNVRIWKLMYCCPAFLQDVPWRLGSNPAELRDLLLTPLSDLVCSAEKSFGSFSIQSHHHIEMLSVWAVFWHCATSTMQKAW